MSFHGWPCWYELATSDTDSERDFYHKILGWTWDDASVPGMQ